MVIFLNTIHNFQGYAKEKNKYFQDHMNWEEILQKYLLEEWYIYFLEKCSDKLIFCFWFMILSLN